ncbi:uncharacterized protein LOC124122349 [Haliotis rufescens]|uniref:uncharacterized protein LOC124122349 n=1 Tax=Haliotis rufescens TaxID=6454 RepID=UPI00201EF6E6|nr:uncharacterized protein LOC124122349 [Haliotis rufescens]
MLRLCALLVTTFMAVQGNIDCERGKYGEHCNLTCPQNCALVQPSNLQFCTRHTGKCSEGCQRGWHGYLCNQNCSVNCLNTTCNQQTGHCTHGCNGQNRGDFCNITGGCGRGWYGDLCQHPCSINCVEERCHHTTGVCILSCNETNPGDFCNITKGSQMDIHNNEKAKRLAVILVPVFLIAIIAVFVTVIVLLIWRRRNKRPQDTSDAFIRQPQATSGDTDEEGDAVEMEPLINSGVMSEDIMDMEMSKAGEAFVKTETYRRVKQTLKEHGHVTLSGFAGGGKTAIASQLLKHCKKRGFLIVHVTDVCKFMVHDNLVEGKSMCFIFHDIFKTVDLTRDMSNLQSSLHQLKQKVNTSIAEQDKKIYVIVTANTYNVKVDISKLGEEGVYFFTGPSFHDFNKLSCQYTPEEKKQIFESCCQGVDNTLDLKKICEFEQSTLGFPQTCKLFWGWKPFRKYREDFFEKPFQFLQQEMKTSLEQMDNHSSALILMFLCEDSLNLQQVEQPSKNKVLECQFTRMQDVVTFSTRTAVANAAREFGGVFLIKGDITGFAHPTIYDACACALFSLNPSLVLEHCHLKFLRENVQYDQHLDTSTVDSYRPIIHVSDVYTDVIAKRLDRINDDSMTKMLQNGDTTSGVMSKALLDKEMGNTAKDFVKTDIYRKVKETLEKHGHVTMSGAAGGGKTAIGLTLGRHYQKEGFDIVYVVDISKFSVDDYAINETNMCFIFHDILRTRDSSNLRTVLQQLKQHKLQNEKKKKLYVIFAANTYNEKDEISQLGEEGAFFFSGPSFLDFNKLACQYTRKEKKQIFANLCKYVHNDLDVERICSFEQSILGFPQACQFFVCFPNFQTHREKFFEKPFNYLKEEIVSILDGENDQSAALALMFLCEGSLNLHQVELPSDNRALEDQFTTIKDTARITTRTAVAMAIRKLRGSFFTKGDITGFAHPAIYDACACALYTNHRAFVLKYCSVKFLCEHVQTDSTVDDERQPMIFVSKAYVVEIQNRLEKMTPQHPLYNTLKKVIQAK